MRKGKKTEPVSGNPQPLEASAFLDLLSTGEFSSRCPVPSSTIVFGDVDLINHPLGKHVVHIPAVLIEGSLQAGRESALRTCHCRVRGDVVLDGSEIETFSVAPDHGPAVSGHFSAKGCRRLTKLSGRFMKNVDLADSGMEVVGPDFFCDDDLSLAGCSSLRLIDGKAPSLLVSGSSLERFGPNASFAQLLAEDCPRLSILTPIANLRWAKFDGSGIREVHQDFECAGPVYFKHCNNLTRLAGRMHKVEVGSAPLEDVSSLRVGEAIFSECPLVPSDMTGMKCKVLVFARCDIEELPRGIDSNTTVRLGDCPKFSRLPVEWKSSLSLSGLPLLRRTPRKFACMGDVDICECPQLENLSGFIGGDLLIMCDTPKLISLDEGLEIRGNLRLAGNSSPAWINCRVGGSVEAKSAQVRETGSEMWVEGNADFTECRNLMVLRGRVGGDTLLSDSSVVFLGADFECAGSLAAARTHRLVSLNCTVGGSVLVDNSSLRKTGPAFECRGELRLRLCPHLANLSGFVGRPPIIDAPLEKRLKRSGQLSLNIQPPPYPPRVKGGVLPSVPPQKPRATHSFAPSQFGRV